MSDILGTQLGQYQITEMISRGGMATVYKAYQPALDRDVAIKVLQRTHDPAFATRFKREARAIARLQHPYILPVYDYGEQGGLLYLVLQYIEGGTTLADLFGEPMEPAPALRMIGHVLDALEYAHQRGVIHRDIKPANILMPAPAWPLLGDFGIAKLVNESGPITQGGLLGTAAYMAPEQAVGRQADARTDLYAVGVVLYELLTGQTPFDATDPVALLHQHVYDPLPPPRSVNPWLPVIVEKILLRALAKNPNARYQSAAEMAAELNRVADQLDRTSTRGQLLQLYEAGVQAFEAERWDVAVEPLAQVVALERDYDDAAELLELARAARRHEQSTRRLFRPSAVRGPARKLLRQGQAQEQAGNLVGALVSYQAAQAEVPPGQARDELAAAAARLTARLRREKGTDAAGPNQCLRCGREVQPEWAGCPYCFAPLNKTPLELERGAPAEPPPAPASPPPVSEPRPDRAPRPAITTPQPEASAPMPPLISAPPLSPRPLVRPSVGEPAPAPRQGLPSRLRGRRSRAWTPLLLGLALLCSGGGIIWATQRRSNGSGEPISIAVGATATLPSTWTRTPAPPPTNTPTSTAISTPSPTTAPTNTPSPTTAPTNTPSPTTAPTPSAPVAVASALLNLRAGPGQEYPSLGVYDQGTSFNLLGRTSAGTWLQAQAADGQVGWLNAQFLQLDGVLTDLPIVAAPPPPPRPTARPQPTPRPSTPRPQPTPAPAPTNPPPAPEPTLPPPHAPTEEPPPPPPPEPTDPPPPPPPEPTEEPPEPTPPPRPEPTPPPRP